MPSSTAWSFAPSGTRPAVLVEIRRILRPGGWFSFAETLVRTAHTDALATANPASPWAWVFEVCSCERDLTNLIALAEFRSVEINLYRIHPPFVPSNTHIAGTAVA
jgi:hypothetical protein